MDVLAQSAPAPCSDTRPMPHDPCAHELTMHHLPRLLSCPSPEALTATHYTSQMQTQTQPFTLPTHTSADSLMLVPLKATTTSHVVPMPGKASHTPKSDATQSQEHPGPTVSRGPYLPYDVVHDKMTCMFWIKLDDRGTLAALCYLPTRFQALVEFYHTEIPVAFRQLGVGDLLVEQAFQWAKEQQILIIPTCPFVQRHLSRYNRGPDGPWRYIVASELEGIIRLIKYTENTTATQS